MTEAVEAGNAFMRQQEEEAAKRQRATDETIRLADEAMKRHYEKVIRLRQEADAAAAAQRTAAEQERAEAAKKRLEEQAVEAEKRQREQDDTQKRREITARIAQDAKERAARDEAARLKAAQDKAARDEAARLKAAETEEHDKQLRVKRDAITARLSAGADLAAKATAAWNELAAKETAARTRLNADKNLVRFAQTFITIINESYNSPNQAGLLQFMMNLRLGIAKGTWSRWESDRVLTHHFDDLRALLRAATSDFNDKSQDKLKDAIQKIVVSEITGLDAASFDENVGNGLSPSPAASPQPGTELPRRLDRANASGADPALDMPLRGNDMREAVTPQQQVRRTDSLFKQKARTEDERQQQLWTIAGATVDELNEYAEQADLTFPLREDGKELLKHGKQRELWRHLGLVPPFLEDVRAKLDSANQGYKFDDLSNILSWSNYKTVRQQNEELAPLSVESQRGVQPGDRKLATLKNLVRIGLVNARNQGIFLPSKARTSR
jgi:hypothetical protein